MGLDLNTLINLGILGVLAFLVRFTFDLRADIRVIKSTLGINGSSHTGLVHEVNKLRESRHEHANWLQTHEGKIALLKQRLDA